MYKQILSKILQYFNNSSHGKEKKNKYITTTDEILKFILQKLKKNVQY